MFKKASHEKWPFITIDEKGDICLNSEIHRTVVKRFDWWTVGRDQLMWKGGAQCRLPLIFPNIWQLDLVHKWGDTFAGVFLKIMLCLGFW